MRTALVLLASCLTLAVSAADRPAGDAIDLGKVTFAGKAEPGSLITATVQFTIREGHHIKSSKPTQEYAIPTKVTLTGTNGVKPGPVRYGATKPIAVAGEGTEPGYEGEMTVVIPLTLAADAKFPVTVPGVLSYQACEGKTCYPPRKLKFELKVGESK